MTTIELAMKKWARKMKDAGAKWKRGVTDKVARYKEGLGRFAGVTPGETMPKYWREGVEAVTPEEFQRAVEGKETYWASRLKEAIAS